MFGNEIPISPPFPRNTNRTPFAVLRIWFTERLVFYCRTTSATTAPCAPRRICCLTLCASYCAPCQPLLRAFSRWVQSPPPRIRITDYAQTFLKLTRWGPGTNRQQTIHRLFSREAELDCACTRGLLGKKSSICSQRRAGAGGGGVDATQCVSPDRSVLVRTEEDCTGSWRGVGRAPEALARVRERKFEERLEHFAGDPEWSRLLFLLSALAPGENYSRQSISRGDALHRLLRPFGARAPHVCVTRPIGAAPLPRPTVGHGAVLAPGVVSVHGSSNLHPAAPVLSREKLPPVSPPDGPKTRHSTLSLGFLLPRNDPTGPL